VLWLLLCAAELGSVVGRFCLLSGRFLFVSMIVVGSDSLLQAPEGMALMHALVCRVSPFGHFSCWFGLRCTRNCRFPLVQLPRQVQCMGVERNSLF